MAATTWSTTDKSNFTLSGGNLTATASGDPAGIRPTNKRTGVKRYVEVKMTSTNSGSAIGLATASWVLSNPTGMGGTDNGSYGIAVDGSTYLNNLQTANFTATWGTNDVLGIAVDDTAKLFWMRVNNGNWNNSGSANPTTGVGGLDYSTMSGTGVCPGIGSLGTPGTVGVLNAGATAFANAAPSGYLAWDVPAIVAARGLFALTGRAATLERSRIMTAAKGDFALTGRAAGLEKGYKLSAVKGSFVFTGNAVTFSRGGAITIAADTGVFTLTGEPAALIRARIMAAARGSFTLTGRDAVLEYKRRLIAARGIFGLTGYDVVLSKGRSFTAATGTFVLTGHDVTFSNGQGIVAEAGEFRFSGNPVGFTIVRHWQPEPTTNPADLWQTVGAPTSNWTKVAAPTAPVWSKGG